jgi:hypothetical protein
MLQHFEITHVYILKRKHKTVKNNLDSSFFLNHFHSHEKDFLNTV